MKNELILIYPNGFEEKIPVKQLNKEEIQLPKEYDKKILYTGVFPRVRGRVRKKQVFYARYGEPFTFDPYTGDIFNDRQGRVSVRSTEGF